ncbi:GNAT family N-acetyltransferase [Pseudoclavibacter chungangensis]|uniref:GNAT family N-acetyltransferase n=1 Tax=Pseudoclavibacter chungangensis TaxID=587635 RepID=A0A7J5C0Z0_9MICO|nr:GNAT family N-acetyltransferase [Pseudoclavibacter chungangensis]KAB1659411.1 GNAT family N-acetyltransferase [Pseudoclavibacter chungangensis]NYJ67747.1 RimJ/RimL family protein N-acetyltransferase [Pseudoclavibacter chungangensis]
MTAGGAPGARTLVDGSEGVVLDALGDRDVDALTALWRDPDAVRFLNVAQPASRADAERSVERARAGDGGVTFAVRSRTGGPLLGTVALHGPAPRGSLSVATAPAARGRGLTTAAVRLLLDRAGRLGYRVLDWECLTDNVASIALAERLGFEFERSGPSTSVLHHRGKPARFATLDLSRDADRAPVHPCAPTPEVG